MFLARNKKTNAIRTVYGLNGTNFLIFNDGTWYYVPMEEYEPMEG